MKQANELRVNNYYDHNGEYRKVTPNTIEEVWNAERTWCKPIPITEDILLKCGFYKDEDINYRFYFDFGWAVILAYDIDDNCIRIGDSWDFTKVIYLHDLQNVIFGLTKTELTINL